MRPFQGRRTRLAATRGNRRVRTTLTRTRRSFRRSLGGLPGERRAPGRRFATSVNIRHRMAAHDIDYPQPDAIGLHLTKPVRLFSKILILVPISLDRGVSGLNREGRVSMHPDYGG